MSDDDKDDKTDAHARHTDPSTSHEAADRMEKSKMEMAVYKYMGPFWPRYLTVIEISGGMGVHPWSVSPRMKPLHNKGFLDEPIKKASLNSNGQIRNLRAWRIRRYL